MEVIRKTIQNRSYSEFLLPPGYSSSKLFFLATVKRVGWGSSLFSRNSGAAFIYSLNGSGGNLSRGWVLHGKTSTVLSKSRSEYALNQGFVVFYTASSAQAWMTVIFSFPFLRERGSECGEHGTWALCQIFAPWELEYMWAGWYAIGGYAMVRRHTMVPLSALRWWEQPGLVSSAGRGGRSLSLEPLRQSYIERTELRHSLNSLDWWSHGSCRPK